MRLDKLGIADILEENIADIPEYNIDDIDISKIKALQEKIKNRELAILKSPKERLNSAHKIAQKFLELDSEIFD